MMNPEIKSKWLEALRSGNYKPGERALRDDNDCFCPIGVLADIICPELWELIEDEKSDEERWFYVLRNPVDSSEKFSCIPKSVSVDIGWDQEAQFLIAYMWDRHMPSYPVSLSNYISYEWTFSTMADWIEMNL